jgi:transcriptional regulator with XRE-family HTH domain
MKDTTNQEGGQSFLKTLREALGGISQEALARRLGVSVVSISRWERGVTPATFTVRQLKNFIEVLREANLDVATIPDELHLPIILGDGTISSDSTNQKEK